MLVGNRMTHNPITITPDVPIAEALEWMRREKVRRFPVVNKKGKLVGKGSLAQISSAITARGGFIVSFNIFLGEDLSNWGCTLKVSDISRDELVETLEPLVIEIVDVREM